MLSGMFPMEALELMVAKVFTDPAPLETPGSVAAGFLRFLHLLSSHDFAKKPLIVDPQDHRTMMVILIFRRSQLRILNKLFFQELLRSQRGLSSTYYPACRRD